MKKHLCLILVLLLSMTACVPSGTDSQPGGTSTSPKPAQTTSTAPASSTAAHRHSYESQQVKDPTCEENGQINYVCACGDAYAEPIQPTGHEWQDWIQTLRPTMSTTGEAKRICGICSKEQTTVVDKNTIEQEIQYYGTLLYGLPEFTNVNELAPGFIFDWVRIQVGTISSEWDEETCMITNVYSLDALNAFTTYYLGRTFDFVYMTQYNDDMEYDPQNNYLIWYTYGAGGGYTKEMVSYQKIDDTHYVIRYSATDMEDEVPTYYGLITLRLEDGKFVIESHTIEQ